MAAGVTDRQRVEQLLPAHALWDCFLFGVDDTTTPEAKRLNTLLALAAVEPLHDMQEPERSKILRRTQRTFHEVMDEYRKEDSEGAKLGLIAYYFLKAVTDCDYLVIGQESVLQKALDMLLPLLEEWAAIPSFDRSAQKQARRLLQHLQGLGYYRGVPLPG